MQLGIHSDSRYEIHDMMQKAQFRILFWFKHHNFRQVSKKYKRVLEQTSMNYQNRKLFTS